MSFDACPWGWGAVCTNAGNDTAWTAEAWKEPTLLRLRAKAGDPAVQSFWPFCFSVPPHARKCGQSPTSHLPYMATTSEPQATS